MVAATGTNGLVREASSGGSRFAQALGSMELQPLHADVGASMNYALAPRLRLSGSVLRTVDRAWGDETAVRVALRMRY